MGKTPAFLSRQLRRARRLLSPALQRQDLVSARDAESGLDLIYRFLLARPIDEPGRRYYGELIRTEGMKLREVAAEIAGSDEFQTRLRSCLAPTDATSTSPPGAQAQSHVDARELAAKLSVEDLARAADEYYRSTLAFTERYLAKPFDDPHDAPDLLISFAQLLAGLRLSPGMSVLDFGAGTCWATRLLTQLGCVVTATDVSGTALEIGRELLHRLPPIGDRPSPRLLVFDGRHLDLPDASVDRIFCFDAFHHVPNPAEVMREFGRVLRPGGIAGFSEPGPHHSKAARSQYEMSNYLAFESDVVLRDVWEWAQDAGFSELELAMFSAESFRVSLQQFEDFTGGARSPAAYEQRLRAFLTGHQTFFLTRRGKVASDSRDREGLKGEIVVRIEASEVMAGQPIRGQATVQNVGPAMWLPGSTTVGGVNLGVHLRFRDGRPVNVDFARVPIEQSTEPGAIRTLRFELRSPAAGDYLLEFDLVSEGVGWFQMNGSATATVPISVRGAVGE